MYTDRRKWALDAGFGALVYTVATRFAEAATHTNPRRASFRGDFSCDGSRFPPLSRGGPPARASSSPKPDAMKSRRLRCSTPSQRCKNGSRVKRKRRQASRMREKGRYSRSPHAPLGNTERDLHIGMVVCLARDEVTLQLTDLAHAHLVATRLEVGVEHVLERGAIVDAIAPSMPPP